MINKTFVEFHKNMIRQAKSSHIPVDVLFELTGRCNLNCKMCYVHVIDNDQAKKNELSTDEWKRIFDEAIDAGMLFATLSGGECLLRSDFKELYLYLQQHGVFVEVKTNALFLDKTYLDFFLRYPPTRIQVSLYGTNDDEYECVTGIRCFDIIEKNICNLASSGIPYKLVLTPCKQSKQFFTNLIDYAKDNCHQYSISQFLISARDDMERDGSDVSVEDIVEYLVYSAKISGKKLLKTELSLLPSPGHGGEELVEKVSCTAGVCRAHVDWRGVMHPCVAIDSVSCSLFTHSFSEGWLNIVDIMKSVTFPAKCRSCIYKCVCKPCYALRCNETLSDCNEDACLLTQMKCSNGLIQL